MARDSNIDSVYHVEIQQKNKNGTVLKMGFGDSAPGNQIVTAVTQLIEQVDLTGGGVVLINGPMTIPVAFIIAHKVLHLFSCIAVFDPKLDGYIVVTNHGSAHATGAIVHESDFGFEPV